MSSSNGHTCRVMYSPISRMISIHYFNLKKPLTNSRLLDDLNFYRDNYLAGGIHEQIYSGLSKEEDDEESNPELPISIPKLFLKRNLKRMHKVIEGNSDVKIHQHLPAYFSSKMLKIRYGSNKTDIIERKRKRKTPQPPVEATAVSGESKPETEDKIHS